MATKKAVKKTAPAKRKTATTRMTSMNAMPEYHHESMETKQPLSRKKLTFFVGLIALAAILYVWKGLFVAAVVNGKPILRVSVIRELEKRQGKSTLDNLINEQIIMDEARKKGISISNEEVDTEVNKVADNLKKQGQDLDQALSFQGMTKDDLKHQILIQKYVEKLLEDKLVVSDDEVKDFIDKNKSQFPKDTSEEDQVTQAKDQLRQQKLNAAAPEWFGQIKSSAKVFRFVNY